MGYFSKENVPASCSSLIAEVTTHPDHPLQSVSDEGLIEMVSDDLDKLGIVDRNDIAETDIYTADHGYVLYDRDRAKSMRSIRAYFDSLGVELHGRFAEFEYINMDEVVRRSMVLAAKLNNVKE
jgi:protoporphyrinogen oxidase